MRKAGAFAASGCDGNIQLVKIHSGMKYRRTVHVDIQVPSGRSLKDTTGMQPDGYASENMSVLRKRGLETT
jgi:hypothetical protein